MKKVIVAGTRGFTNYQLLEKSLLSYFKDKNLHHEDIIIVSGTCKGADKLGEQFAYKWNCKCVQFPPNWDAFGKAAGYKRNLQMGEYAKDNGVLFAFWNGVSKGTKLMIDIANDLKIETHIIEVE